MEPVLANQVVLGPEDMALIAKIAGDLPILADLCRADLVLYGDAGPGGLVVALAHAKPHSSTPLYEAVPVGEQTTLTKVAGHVRVGRARSVRTIALRGATVAREVVPIIGLRGRCIGYLRKDAYWLAHERQRRRSPVFQRALIDLVYTVLHGELAGAEHLTPFGEHDGIVYVGPDRRVQYMSGIASELYRHLGYRDNLVGRRISEIETIDHQMALKAVNERTCLEAQSEQDGLTWERKAIPITGLDSGPFSRLGLWQPRAARRRRSRGVFILVHDATEALRTQRELEAKMALVREVHHRVKNNLQVIASIMRMEARRTVSPEAKAALEESVNRVLSVAVVHEFLSQNAKGAINLKEVAHRILGQVEQGLIAPDKRIELRVAGPDIWLPAERATQCALVTNELVQNALEHGMAHRQAGRIEVELVDHGGTVSIVVSDDGEGLPEGFDITTGANLGLQIVRSMVERDLRGTFSLQSGPYGARAHVRFDK